MHALNLELDDWFVNKDRLIRYDERNGVVKQKFVKQKYTNCQKRRKLLCPTLFLVFGVSLKPNPTSRALCNKMVTCLFHLTSVCCQVSFHWRRTGSPDVWLVDPRLDCRTGAPPPTAERRCWSRASFSLSQSPVHITAVFRQRLIS